MDFDEILMWFREYWDLIILLIVVGLLWYRFNTNNELMLNLFLLFIGAFVVEKRYVSRLGVLPNIVVIYFLFQSVTLPPILNYYLLGGIILGVASIYYYCTKNSLPQVMYSISYPLYSLKSVLGLYIPYLLLGPTFDFFYTIISIITLGAIWTLAVQRLDHKPPLKIEYE